MVKTDEVTKRHIINTIKFLEMLVNTKEYNITLLILNNKKNIELLKTLKNGFERGIKDIDYLLKLDKIPKDKSY